MSSINKIEIPEGYNEFPEAEDDEEDQDDFALWS